MVVARRRGDEHCRGYRTMRTASRLRLAVLTDIHIAPQGSVDGRWNNPVVVSQSRDLLRRAIAEAAAARVQHVIVLGDAADAGDEGSAVEALEIAAGAGVPVWAVPGNHDVAAGIDAVTRAADTGGSALVALDAEARPLTRGISVCGVRITSADGGRTCRATGLPARLDPGPPLLVVATHYPVMSVKPRLKARELRDPGDLVNRRDLQRAVAARPAATVALHGHVHVPVQLAHAQLLQIGCAPLAEWPYAWTLIEMAADARTVVVTRHDGSGLPPDVDTILSPRRAVWQHDGILWHALPGDARTAASLR